jgi:hypothetical protein
VDGARLSQFPHLSWLGFSFAHAPASGTLCHVIRGTTHALNMVFSGLGHVRWLRRGNEVRYDATPGSLHFVPADGEVHTFLANAPREASAYTLFLPQRHLDALAAEDHSPSRCEYHRLFIASDAILQIAS